MLKLLLAALLLTGCARAVLWEFRRESEGWLSLPPRLSAVEAEQLGGQLLGSVLDWQPMLQSPEVALPPSEARRVVLRLRYSGSAKLAAVSFNNGSAWSEPVTFPLSNDGTYNVYTLLTPEEDGQAEESDGSSVTFVSEEDGRPMAFPIVSHMRLHPARWTSLAEVGGLGQFWLDWIALLEEPRITSVSGCLPLYYASRPHNSSALASLNASLPFESTYNCKLAGGQRLVVRGTSLGDVPFVTVDGTVCGDVEVLQEGRLLSCTVPAASRSGAVWLEVTNGEYTGLRGRMPMFYADASFHLAAPAVANVAAHSVVLLWDAPSPLQRRAVTGYQLYAALLGDDDEQQPLAWQLMATVGNVTSGIVRGLQSDAPYVFAVSALVEDVQQVAALPQDRYNERPAAASAVASPLSDASAEQWTLPADIDIAAFDLEAMLPIGPQFANSTTDAVGRVGGEGGFGFTLVGSAHLQGCNTTHSCCDGFDGIDAAASCEAVCEPRAGVRPPGALNGSLANVANVVSGACGPRLRLTPAEARQAGAAWYGRRMNVREGFSTQFDFQLASPSFFCPLLDGVHSLCRSRGADGFAFVVQADSGEAVGSGGSGLGYAGLRRALAIEIDSWFNAELMDDGENHLSVQTASWPMETNSNHTQSLAAAPLPDVTDGVHTIRIVYEPQLGAGGVDALLNSDRMRMSGHVTELLSRLRTDDVHDSLASVAMPHGAGLLRIYFDDMNVPILLLPLELDTLLALDAGEAWVGFTAATGEQTWQTHDILNWRFSMLRQEPPAAVGAGTPQPAASTTRL